jgi:hypothetical protein
MNKTNFELYLEYETKDPDSSPGHIRRALDKLVEFRTQEIRALLSAAERKLESALRFGASR